MEKVGLYIHIPFCRQKCRYCDFSSFQGMKEKEIERYIEALCAEIRGFSKKNSKITLGTVYFGGGTPSYIHEKYIARVMALIKALFFLDPESEVTLEANPATVDLKKARAYKKMGFNRVSLGLQTTSDKGLKGLGRVHNYQDFIKSYDVFRGAGFTNLSADLMFGLPEQTMADVEQDLKRIGSLSGLCHISCYSLKVEEGTVFHTQEKAGKLILPKEETERSMQHKIIEKLATFGFEQYELSNFSKVGFESRHNGLYWTLAPYLGFGLGAASYYKEERSTNVSNFEDYCCRIEAGKMPVEETHTLSIDEKKGDFMFLGLRKTTGVLDKEYQNIFGTSFYKDFPEIKDLMAQGLLLGSEDSLCLSPKGQDLANQVFMAFV